MFDRLTKTLLILGVVTAFFLPVASAETMSPQQLIAHIIATNPDLARSKAEAEADIAALQAENKLPDTEISFEYQFGQGHVGDKNALKLTQQIEWPGLYSARSSAIKAFSQARQSNIDAARQQLELKVRLLLADLTYTARMRKWARQTETMMQEVVNKLNAAYDQRQATALDIRKARLSLASAGIKVNQYDSRIVELIAEIKSLSSDTTLSVTAYHDYLPEKILSDTEYRQSFRANNPDIIAADNERSLARAELTVAKRTALPGLSFSAVRAYELGDYFNGFEIGLSLPLWSAGAKKSAAKSRLVAADINACAVSNSASVLADAELAKLADIDRRILPYKEFVNDDKYTQLLFKAFDGGQINVIEYITELSYFAEILAQYEELIYNRQIIAINLNRYNR